MYIHFHVHMHVYMYGGTIHMTFTFLQHQQSIYLYTVAYMYKSPTDTGL